MKTFYEFEVIEEDKSPMMGQRRIYLWAVDDLELCRELRRSVSDGGSMYHYEDHYFINGHQVSLETYIGAKDLMRKAGHVVQTKVIV